MSSVTFSKDDNLGQTELLKFISPLSFYSLMWLLENERLQTWLAFVACGVFLLDSAVREDSTEDAILGLWVKSGFPK